MATNGGNIEDIFREAFESHEMSVSPDVWAGVQSSLAGSAAAGSAAATGTGFMLKAAMVVGVSTLVAVGTVSEIQYQSEEEAVVNVEQAAPETHGNTSDAALYTEDQVATDQEGVAMSDTEVEVPSSEASAEVASDMGTAQPDDSPINYSIRGSVTDRSPRENIESSNEQVAATTASSAESADDQEVADQNPTVQAPAEKENQPEKEERTPVVVQTVEPAEEQEEEVKGSAAIFHHAAKAFISADGDGTNDCFSTQAEHVQSFYIRIYDKGGQLLFQSDVLDFKWCGTDLSGRPLPDKTVCYYQIEAVGEDAALYTRSNARGSITVFRR